MKLSVLNSTSRQGRVSSLTATKKADEDFYDPKYPIIKKAATRSCQIFDRVAKKTKKMLMNLVYTVNQGEMVHTSSKPSGSSKRQEVIDWLKAHNYPALPVAPVQSAGKHPKVRERPKTTCSLF
jgi:hypothetical protein